MNLAQFMHHFNETLRSDQVAINILHMTFLLLGLATNEAYILVSSILLVSQSWQDQKSLWSFKLDVKSLFLIKKDIHCDPLMMQQKEARRKHP